MIAIAPHNKFNDSIKQIDVPIKPTIVQDCAIVFSAVGAYTLATKHVIKNGRLGEGVPVNAQRLLEKVVTDNMSVQASESGQTRCDNQCNLLPQNVIFDNSQKLVWHTKAIKRSMWFKVGTQLQVNVWWPAMLFVLDRTSKRLNIFALASNARPNANTRLYRAPIMNTASCGDFCFGGATLPEDLSTHNIDAIERCIFDSFFTHLNSEDNTHPIFSDNTTHLRFWRDKQKTQTKVKVSELPLIGRVTDLDLH